MAQRIGAMPRRASLLGTRGTAIVGVGRASRRGRLVHSGALLPAWYLRARRDLPPRIPVSRCCHAPTKLDHADISCRWSIGTATATEGKDSKKPNRKQNDIVKLFFFQEKQTKKGLAGVAALTCDRDLHKVDGAWS